MKRVHLIALIVGLVTDFIGTMIAFGTVTLVFFALRGTSGQGSLVMFHAIARDPRFLLTGYIAGMASTLLGAYVVARMSRPHSVLNTLLFGIISLFGVIFFARNLHWYNVMGALAIIPVSLVPGYLLARQRSNQAMERTPDRPASTF